MSIFCQHSFQIRLHSQPWLPMEPTRGVLRATETPCRNPLKLKVLSKLVPPGLRVAVLGLVLGEEAHDFPPTSVCAALLNEQEWTGPDVCSWGWQGPVLPPPRAIFGRRTPLAAPQAAGSLGSGASWGGGCYQTPNHSQSDGNG